jgi:hypothetical protein
MKKSNYLFALALLFIGIESSYSQNTNPNDLGAWYMYFFTAKFKDSRFGVQGDVQYRNWNLIGDTEQLLLRAGATYNPAGTNVTLTAGVANITTGALGEDNNTINENRIYQEVLMPQKVGMRLYFVHRFRYEQRFVENQDFRTRMRYNLFLNIPLNKKEVTKNTLYAAFYNELFINGERSIGNGKQVPFFDRNRFYSGLGYGFTKTTRMQLGYMNQSTEVFSKNQVQLSVHHNF